MLMYIIMFNKYIKYIKQLCKLFICCLKLDIKNQSIQYLTCLLHLSRSPLSFSTSVSALSIVLFALSTSIFNVAASVVLFSNFFLRSATLPSTRFNSLSNFPTRCSAFSKFLIFNRVLNVLFRVKLKHTTCSVKLYIYECNTF